MANVNPYQVPRAAVADAAEQVQPVRIFSVSGRIGRARYIAYTLGLSVLIMFAASVLARALGEAGPLVGIAGAVLTLVITMMLTVQRSHDFNVSGWLAILALIPLVNLIFWFIPGSDGANRFGAPTPPNSVLVLIGAWIVPFFFILGIVAAIAIPAYQDYAKRAAQQR
jgi:uncharacterized membrane protein YhaH (DUF805 family)